MPKLIPEVVMKELAHTNRRPGAAKAQSYRLVNGVFDSADALLAGALQCASEIAAKPPVAISGTKQAIHDTHDHSVGDALKQIGWLQGAIWSNAYVRESVAAMKEKRAGQFMPPSPLTAFSEQG